MLLLRTFGGLSLENGGRPVVGAAVQRRRLAVLAVLAVANDTGVSRDTLCALFWPDSDMDRARGALKQTLYALRRDVGEKELTSGSNELRLNPDVITSDVANFDRALISSDLPAAVEQYRGPFLDGVHIRDATEFEQWADEHRRAFAAKYADALEKLTVVAIGRHELSAAVEWARRLNAADALNTRAALLLMSALDTAGDRAGAIKHGELHAALLRHELEVEPSAELVQALELVRNPAAPRPGDPTSLRSSAVPPLRVPEAPVAVAPAIPIASKDFRQAEWPGSGTVLPRVVRRATIAAVGVLTMVAVFVAASNVRERPRSTVFAITPLRSPPGDSALDRLRTLAAGTIVQHIVKTVRTEVLDLRHAATGALPSESNGVSRDVAIARSAGADRVISGYIFRNRRGESAFVHMQILNADDGRVVQQLDPVAAPIANVDDILGRLRDRVGGVVAALTDTLYPAWTAAGSRVPTYSAYLEFMQGLDAIVHSAPQAPQARPTLAIAHLTRASQLDTAFLQARIWLIQHSDLEPGMRLFTDSVQATALAQRDGMSAFDQASLDNIVAIRAGSWEDALAAAQRMVVSAPTLQDALFALAKAQMATRRYAKALVTLHAMGATSGWMTDLSERWKWDLQAHHLLGEYSVGLEHWRTLRAAHPDDSKVCLWGVPDLIALRRETAVDSLIATCAALVGGTLTGAPLIPNRSYFDIALPHYLAHGNIAAARRAADRIRPELARFAKAQRPKARDLATIDCMLGDWAVCYPKLMLVAEIGPLGRRRLGVAAAHMRDTVGVNAALQFFDSNEVSMHRGYPDFARAMIASAGGKRMSALALFDRARRAGLSPAGSEWTVWGTFGTTAAGPMGSNYDWYHAWELLPLYGDPILEAMIRAQK